MANVMRIDVAPFSHLIAIAIFSFIALMVAIIVGATGPDTTVIQRFTAYQCPNNSHDWDPKSCTGTQMSTGAWSPLLKFPALEAMNKYWRLEMYIYNQFVYTNAVQLDLDVEVTVYGDRYLQPWSVVIANETKSVLVDCAIDSDTCMGVVLIYNEAIEYTDYVATVKFNGSIGFVGDVEFILVYGKAEYHKLQIGFKAAYILLDVILCFMFFGAVHSMSWKKASWEQKGTFGLLVAAVFLNNPFFALEFIVSSWWLILLAYIFEVTYTATLLLYWLLLLDKAKKSGRDLRIRWFQVAKFILVGIYAVLALALYIWDSAQAEKDPVLDEMEYVPGLLVLFYLVSGVYMGTLVWLLLLVAIEFQVVREKPYLLSRFIFAVVPMIICILSIVIGVFFGTLGPVGSNTTSFMYFITLNNLYVWLMVYGYWPIQFSFDHPNAREEQQTLFNVSSIVTTNTIAMCHH